MAIYTSRRVISLLRTGQRTLLLISTGRNTIGETRLLSVLPDMTRHEEWKTRAPYAIHRTEDEFEARYSGSCNCGRVQYQLSRERPLASKYCHCTTCQVLHGIHNPQLFPSDSRLIYALGAPFQWAAIFHKEDINFTKGHHGLTWYDSHEKTTKHKLPCKVRCEYCHTPIMDEGRNMILLFPTLIDFKDSVEDRKKFDPT